MIVFMLDINSIAISEHRVDVADSANGGGTEGAMQRAVVVCIQFGSGSVSVSNWSTDRTEADWCLKILK
jgi:hypothetical protein